MKARIRELLRANPFPPFGAEISADVVPKSAELAQRCGLDSVATVKTLAFTYWQDGDAWLGHLEEFPDYLTQGESLEDLKAHLLDLYRDLASGVIPCARHRAEMEVA